jgi:drug/metabolite transporter (DMT)-like permease
MVLKRTERAAERVDDARRDWRSWIAALACAGGLSGSNAFHILATHYIPAAEANLISYLWPVMIVGIGALLGLELFSWGLVIGAIVIVLAGFLSRAESRQTQS